MRETILESRVIQFKDIMGDAQVELMNGSVMGRYRHLRRAVNVLENMREEIETIYATLTDELAHAKQTYYRSAEYDTTDDDQHDLWKREDREAWEQCFNDAIEESHV